MTTIADRTTPLLVAHGITKQFGGIIALDHVDMEVAAGEAVANAVEHGHRDRPDGVITLRAATEGATLRLCICDTGRWKAPDPVPDGRRGRGISLMHALMDDVAVESRADGTTVRMSVNLR